jgi:hypothetical protein
VQARPRPSSPNPYLPAFSTSPDLRASNWPPAPASPLPPFSANALRASVPRSASWLLGAHSRPSSPLASHVALPWPRQPSPQSPHYSPTPSWGGGAAPAPQPAAAAPPRRQATPTHMCDANCGFEGGKGDVLLHETTCTAWAAWNVKRLAKRRASDRKRKQRQDDQANDHRSAGDVEFAAYLLDVADAKGSARKLAFDEDKEQKLAEHEKKTKERAAQLAKQHKLFAQQTAQQGQKLMRNLASNVPKHWTEDAKARFEVPKDSDEYREIEAELKLNLEKDKLRWQPCEYKLHALFRTVNRAAWTAFELRRILVQDAMKQRHSCPEQTSHAYMYPGDCARVFHGTTVGAAATIMQDGFNRSAGRNGAHGAILGKGTYFSPLARLSLSGEPGTLSNVYTPPDADGFKHLLLCDVLLGCSIVGRPEYNVFPPHVHSTVERLNAPTKICVQHDSSINVLYEVVISYQVALR